MGGLRCADQPRAGAMMATEWTSAAEMRTARTPKEQTDRLQKEAAPQAHESGRQGEEEPPLFRRGGHHAPGQVELELRRRSTSSGSSTLRCGREGRNSPTKR